SILQCTEIRTRSGNCGHGPVQTSSTLTRHMARVFFGVRRLRAVIHVATFEVYAYRAYTGTVSIEFDPGCGKPQEVWHILLRGRWGPERSACPDARRQERRRRAALRNHWNERFRVADSRIISVRRADPKERRNYEKGL